MRAESLHRAREMAESFGVDAERYDRSRPPYPPELIGDVVARGPGSDFLDVGTGTGIVARQFRAAGCSVVGVEPDPRMAAFARAHGVPHVDVATFEAWDSLGRRFDAVIAGQSWHWVAPDVGAAKAAELLRANGTLALFGHVFEPPEPIGRAQVQAYVEIDPSAPPASLSGRRPVAAYESMYAGFARAIEATGDYRATPELMRYRWTRTYTTAEWLDFLPTTGTLATLSADHVDHILAAVGQAIDDVGGCFTMEFVTLALFAVKK